MKIAVAVDHAGFPLKARVIDVVNCYLNEMTEAILEGAAPSEAIADRAASALAGELNPIDDVRSSADYRRAVAARVARGVTDKVTITTDFIRETLGPQRYVHEQRLTTSAPGVVTGLAYTPAGGEILHVEATRYLGKGNLTLTGQIEGGVITGFGFALMEENVTLDGRISTANLGESKLPSIADVPPLKTVLVETPTGPTPFGGKAIAENPNVPTAAAIANAVADACGVRIFDLPLTAEKIYWQLKQGHG